MFQSGPWLIAAVLAVACSQPASEPEARIRAELAAAEAAAESGDVSALASQVARDYADRAGRDRRALVLTLRGLLMRYPHLELVVTIREIEIHTSQLATVRLDVLAAGAGPRGISGDVFPLELSLRDDGGGWRVTRAEWGRRLGDGI
ncbi:MAG: hypothetical protein ACNA8J_00890 [Gammaproteobacteria bacterium]